MPQAPAYVLDTNVLIHYARASPAGRAIENHFQFATTNFKPMVCVVTLGEIRALALRKNWGTKKLDQLQLLLDNVVHLNIDSEEVIAAYADIHTFATSKGNSIGDNDIWIAAVTRVSNSTLITTDKDFNALHPDTIHRILIDARTGQFS